MSPKAPASTSPEGKSDETFFNTECRRFAKKYGFKEEDLPRGLEGFAAHVFVREDGFNDLADGDDADDAELSDYICRSNDLGADVVLTDEDGRRIMITQCGWAGKAGPDEDKIKAFFGIVDNVLNPDYLSKGGEQVQHLLGALQHQLDDGFEVILRFVTNRPVGENKKLAELVNAANDRYRLQGRSVTCELHGRTEILKLRTQLDAGLLGAAVPVASFKIQNDRCMLLDQPKMPYKTLIALVKANELVGLYNTKGIGPLLFNLNVRLPLASKKINPQIEKTATSPEEAQHFAYYNNGISAVCGSFDLKDNTVTAERLQIVNGAQTLSSLVKAKGNLQPETYVLLRLTATKENYGGDFTENIISANNIQNPVKAADFFSNDPLQKWISQALAPWSGKGAMPTFEYIFKSGMKSKKGHKAIGIEALANIRHAFIRGPVVSFREPKSFFVRGVDGRYDEAFGVDGQPVASWGDETLAECCAAIAITYELKRIARDIKKKEKAKEQGGGVNVEAKYLDRLARYIAALVGVGLRAAMPGDLSDFRTLMASRATFDNYCNPLVGHARTIVRAAIAPRYTTAQQPEYNFARSEGDWLLLEAQIREAVENAIVTF